MSSGLFRSELLNFMNYFFYSFDIMTLENHLNAMHVAACMVVNKLVRCAETLHFQYHYSGAQHIFRGSA